MIDYLLSILGVVILGVVIDLVLPTGQMNKYIKGIFGIFTVLVVISPFPKLLNIDYDFSNLFYSEASTQIDEDFLEVTNRKIVEQLCISIEEACKSSGYDGIECEIVSNLENNKFVIEKIILNLQKMVISGSDVHINKYTEIVQAVKQVVSVEKEQIVFNE